MQNLLVGVTPLSLKYLSISKKGTFSTGIKSATKDPNDTDPK